MKRSRLSRKTWLKRGKPLARRSRIKPKRRTASEYARIYGSEARVQAIKAMPCTVPHCSEGPCHNAHLTNGGMGRKADWDTIVPLCPKHHHALDNGLGSVEAFDAMHGTSLWATAARLAKTIPATGEVG